MTEAIWTRYMPSRQLINDILKSGIIGEYKLLTANLGYEMNHKKRLVEPMLAGGALLDVGIYPINFALMTFGTDFEKIDSTVFMTPSNVDGMESITIKYKDGKMAQLFSTMHSATDRRGVIYGDKGYMEIENINNPESIKIFDNDHKCIKSYDIQERVNGYEYELIECVESIKEGKI